MRALLDIILGLSREDVRALSCIIIERSHSGAWMARLSICRNKFASGSSGVSGVAMMSWERVPDQEHRIDIDELHRDASVRAQAAALVSSRLVGRLDMARFDSPERTTKYIIKTHAGSQAERTKWLMGLRELPENTIWMAEGQRQIP